MKYDLKSFKPIVDNSPLKISIFGSHVGVSIGLKRRLRAMRLFALEVMRNGDCICLRVIPNPNKSEPLPSIVSVDRLVSCEVRRCRTEILEIYGVRLDNDEKLDMVGICDEDQNAIFFPKENASKIQVRRKNDELQ